ncbi:MAG: ABC transporter substrate-binding protein [Thermodesulfobacteriota bacterium]
MRKGLKTWLGIASLVVLLVLTLTLPVRPAVAETVLKARLDSSIKQLDPIWSTGYAIRAHGFLVYDTLFGLDEKLNVQPQMVDKYEVTDNGRVYSFTLRQGLKWHDGTPVTAKDCVASIKRWGARDGVGQKLMEATDKLEALDDKTFKLTLKSPFGQVLTALAKLTPNVPFMMKEEQAKTDPNEQVKEVIGSGPFKFVKEQFQPGIKSVYVKNVDYVPRQEQASNTAGGKIPKVDRVEITWIPDPNTAMNALIAGEIDYIQDPPPDLQPTMKKAAGVKVENMDALGSYGVIRLNHNQPPFNNVKARLAVLHATNVEDALRAAVGNDPELFKPCYSIFSCASPFASEEGSEPLKKPDFAKAKQLLQEAGYKGEPIVLLQATDDVFINAQCLVTAQNLRKAGFNVAMQAMDWSTLVSRRANKKSVAEGGWHAFQTWFYGLDFVNPVEHIPLGAACDKAWFGWPCDEQIEKLRTAFVQEPDLAKQKEIAKALQKRAFEIVTYVPLGMFYQPVAYRADRLTGLLKSSAQIFWNVSKK